jgi:small subunit ribosomal protein S8
MALNDNLSNVMSKINNAEKTGKNEVTYSPSSKIIVAVLKELKEHLYLGEIAESGPANHKTLNVSLIKKINKCGAIKPRFSVETTEFEKFEKRYLIAKDFGIIIVSTNKGIMTHAEAKEKGLGGRLLAYCY